MIIFSGLPASGKTTMGKILAEELNWEFIDTDRLIEKAYNKKPATCSEIFKEEGKKYFRELEKNQIIAIVDKKTPTVVALGGGALNDPDNVKILRSAGTLIYLQVPLEVVWKRIEQRGIPAYLDPTNPEQSFHELAQKRIPLYEKASHITLKTAVQNGKNIWQVILSETFSKSQHGESPMEKPSESSSMDVLHVSNLLKMILMKL